MGSFNILQKCDNALVAYLIAGGAGSADNVLPNKRSRVMTMPVTVCESHDASPVSNDLSGTYEIDASIYVRTRGFASTTAANTAGVPASDSGDRVSATFDLFNIQQDQSGEPLATAINAAAGTVSGFKMQDVRVHRIRAGFEAKGDAWCDIIDLKIVCSANDAAV